MKDFDDVLALAMVGTARGQLPAPSGPLAPTLNAVQGDTEGMLLGRAALAGLVRWAGQTATPLTDLPAPAPAETKMVAPARFARHFDAESKLLAEWLHLCAEANWLLPPAQLPALLNLTRHRAELREGLRPVLGERGAWLAQFMLGELGAWWVQFSPESRVTSRAFLEEEWLELGEAQTQKEMLFRALRAADSEAARHWLTEQWKTERAGVKKRMLGVILETVEAADAALEPVLEAALTDRSIDVQDLARELLMRIPQSAYNARMAARLLPEREAHLKKAEQVRDADWKKDRLDIKATPKEAIREILEHTHPEAAMHALGRTPEGLADWAKALGASKALLAATLKTGYLPLAKALLPQHSHHLELMQLAAPDQLEGYLLAEVAKGNSSPQRLQEIAACLPLPVPQSVALPLLEQVREHCQATKYADAYAWSSFATWLAQNIDPTTPLPAELNVPFEADAQDFSEYGRRSFNEALQTLAQRAELHRDYAAAKAEAQ